MFMVREFLVLIILLLFYGDESNVAIYGADQSGAQLFLLLNDQRYQLVAFVDSNKEKRRTLIHGVRVYDLENINRLTRHLK